MLKLFLLTYSLFFSVQLAVGTERDKSNEGPLAVEIAADLTFRDEVRQKELSCKVYFPKEGGPYPVILFSHGFGGTQDAFGPISQHWASHGYVIIHPTHADGLGRGNPNPNPNPTPVGVNPTTPQPRFRGLLGGLNSPDKINDRVADLVLILDRLDTLPKLVPGLKGKIDSTQIGVGGHSFGAYTSMLIGGVTVDLGPDRNKSFLDNRVRCILPISAQGTGQQGLTEKSWNALKLPMMTITGTRDQGAGRQGVDWKKEPFRYSPVGDKYLVVIDGANHVSFGGALGVRGNAITTVVKLSSTHFWDAYLKESQTSKRYLQSNGLIQETGGKCAFEKK